MLFVSFGHLHPQALLGVLGESCPLRSKYDTQTIPQAARRVNMKWSALPRP